MKHKLTITIVLGLGLWWAAGVFSACSASSYLPWNDSLDIVSQQDFYSDLDVRDEMNRKVNSASAKENLRFLFLSGLSEQLARQDLGIIRKAFAVIQKAVETGAYLTRFALKTIGKIIAVAATELRIQTKMLVKVIRWLPPLLNFVVLSLALLLAVAPTKKTPLVLRC